MKKLMILVFLLVLGWGSMRAESHFPTKDQAFELLRGVCPNDLGSYKVGGPRKEEYGCNACPSFTGMSGNSAGLYDRTAGSFLVESVIYGHFTARDRDEVVLSFAGCEARVENMGGSVILRKSVDGWQKVDYLPGVRFWGDGLSRAHGEPSVGCQTYDLKDKRQILLCEDVYTGQGVYEWTIGTLDLAEPGKRTGQNLFFVSDDTNTCAEWITVASIDRVEIHDLNKDGMADVSVFAKIARVKARVRDENGCPKGWLADNRKDGYLRDSPQVKTYRLDFLFNARHLTSLPGARPRRSYSARYIAVASSASTLRCRSRPRRAVCGRMSTKELADNRLSETRSQRGHCSFLDPSSGST